MIFKKSNIFFIYIYLLLLINCKDDPSTFANIQQIVQKNIEANFNIDFDNEIIHGQLKIYFNSLMDGEVIVLDTKNLNIFSIIDSDTGDELEWELDTVHSLDALGVPLKIYKDYKKDDIVTILIKYDTTNKGEAVQFLSKDITSSGYPFMFTQCESIYCRSLLPIQDTPAAKITV
jgi:leukotriene-A4 hydrolase